MRYIMYNPHQQPANPSTKDLYPYKEYKIEAFFNIIDTLLEGIATNISSLGKFTNPNEYKLVAKSMPSNPYKGFIDFPLNIKIEISNFMNGLCPLPSDKLIYDSPIALLDWVINARRLRLFSKEIKEQQFLQSLLTKLANKIAEKYMVTFAFVYHGLELEINCRKNQSAPLLDDIINILQNMRIMLKKINFTSTLLRQNYHLTGMGSGYISHILSNIPLNPFEQEILSDIISFYIPNCEKYVSFLPITNDGIEIDDKCIAIVSPEMIRNLLGESIPIYQFENDFNNQIRNLYNQKDVQECNEIKSLLSLTISDTHIIYQYLCGKLKINSQIFIKNQLDNETLMYPTLVLVKLWIDNEVKLKKCQPNQIVDYKNISSRIGELLQKYSQDKKTVLSSIKEEPKSLQQDYIISSFEELSLDIDNLQNNEEIGPIISVPKITLPCKNYQDLADYLAFNIFKPHDGSSGAAIQRGFKSLMLYFRKYKNKAQISLNDNGSVTFKTLKFQLNDDKKQQVITQQLSKAGIDTNDIEFMPINKGTKKNCVMLAIRNPHKYMNHSQLYKAFSSTNCLFKMSWPVPKSHLDNNKVDTKFGPLKPHPAIHKLM